MNSTLSLTAALEPVASIDSQPVSHLFSICNEYCVLPLTLLREEALSCLGDALRSLIDVRKGPSSTFICLAKSSATRFCLQLNEERTRAAGGWGFHTACAGPNGFRGFLGYFILRVFHCRRPLAGQGELGEGEVGGWRALVPLPTGPVTFSVSCRVQFPRVCCVCLFVVRYRAADFSLLSIFCSFHCQTRDCLFVCLFVFILLVWCQLTLPSSSLFFYSLIIFIVTLLFVCLCDSTFESGSVAK